MDVMEHVYAKAKEANATIVLAERDDRVVEATNIIEEKGLAKVVVLENGLHEAANMVAAGKADGYVAGNISSTTDTIRSALKTVGTTGFASSYFIMLHNDKPLFFADCAFNIKPNAEQLAKIGVQTAESAGHYGVTPKVAFLSFSTHGSADHGDVAMVREAVAIAKELAPDVAIDGELQFDAAFVPGVAERKAPGSLLRGEANVFVFPDLNAGNIGYKIAQRIGGCQAIGPILQGFTKPVNDLSRGCSVQDIVDVVAITAMQARSSSEPPS